MNPPTKAEVSKAIKSLKSGKAAGPDGIPPEALKADVQTSTEMIHPLLMKIWENEQIPVEWKKGYLVKLPKKGDLSSCNKLAGYMLLSIPCKILTRIILERIKKALDETLREEQAGFRQDRSCTDHIATLRIIIEQSLEWQIPLYSTQDAQEKLSRLAEEAEKTGLNINIKKTVVMRKNNKKQDPITLHDEDLNEVEKFVYLGSVVNTDGGTDEDIKSRINKARHAFNTLRPIWNSSALSLHNNKIRIFNTNVKSVLLYGSETWRTTKSNTQKLQTFINRCFRNIINIIRWPDVISNADLWDKTGQSPIEVKIKKRKWGGSATHSGSPPQTSPSKPSTGILKESVK
ncbi:uncharacterized protein [Montipora capricornis]|uniref:uncharacterized protein n=1 Tax=Montipora capricornis TaxID=246305 RepID=UPI0035F1183E